MRCIVFVVGIAVSLGVSADALAQGGYSGGGSSSGGSSFGGGSSSGGTSSFSGGQPSFGAVTTPRGRTGTATVGRGGPGTTTNSFGIVTPAQSPITYTLEVRFKAPPIAAPRVQADLQGIIDRTSQLRQTGNVRVE